MDGRMLLERRFCEKFEFARYTISVPNVDGMGPEKEFPPVETSGEETTLPSCSGIELIVVPLQDLKLRKIFEVQFYGTSETVASRA
jgi:hypothetical protein